MRLIKRQTTNLRSITGKGVQYDIDNQVVVDSERAMVVPVGTEGQRPGEAGVITGATNGQIRYNTTTNELEAYQNSAWRNIRFKEPNRNPGIHQQTPGTGDATSTIFGPLNSNDPDYPTAHAAEHVIVLIENVFQLATTNYTLIQNPPASDPGSEAIATTIQDGVEYKITSLGTTDFTLLGAASNTVDVVFTADLQGGAVVPTGDGTVRLTGQYVRFNSAVPLGKDVTVIHNFDK